MTRALPLSLITLALAGCMGTGSGRPAVEIRTVEKTVEVAKPCPVEQPARPAAIGALPTDLAALAAILGAKLKEYAAPGGYADRASAAIETCRRAGATAAQSAPSAPAP